jgi:hypothetical protein
MASFRESPALIWEGAAPETRSLPPVQSPRYDESAVGSYYNREREE